MTAQQQQFWMAFLAETGRPADTACYECFHFDNNEQAANALLAMVLSGQKTAASSALPAYEAEGSPPPAVGGLSIVTDWEGTPRCVIETTCITVLPFEEITYDICKREGEDDTLASWRATHTRFFAEDGAALGYAFTPRTPVVFEDFRRVYPL